jgi:dTDP-glucose 4,6-dehydratase
MSTVVLTGAGGFIGSHALDYLLSETNHEVVCIDSFRHKGKTDRIRIMLDKHGSDRVRVYTHDLTVPISQQLQDLIGEVDQIWNFASDSAVGRSITEPVPLVQNNVNLILTMLEYARNVKPRFFFQVSTDEVYGPAPLGVDHKEWEVILPSNPYSASKAAQEAIAISYWRTYGVPVVITNTMNNIGEMQDPEKFVPLLVQRIHNDEVVPVYGSTGNDGSRFYLHAREHASALNFIANNTEPSIYYDSDDILIPDRYNVVGSVELGNLEIAQLVANLMGKELRYELVDFHSTRPGHDRRYALDGSKMKDLGWELDSSFEDSLNRTIEWTLNNPEWMKD